MPHEWVQRVADALAFVLPKGDASGRHYVFNHREIAEALLPKLIELGGINVELKADKLHARVGTFDFDAPQGTTRTCVTRLDGKQLRYPTEIGIQVGPGQGFVHVTLVLAPMKTRVMTDEEVAKAEAERTARRSSPAGPCPTRPYARAVYPQRRSLCGRCGSWIEQADDSHECVAR